MFSSYLGETKPPTWVWVRRPNEIRPNIKAFRAENGQRKYLNPPSVRLFSRKRGMAAPPKGHTDKEDSLKGDVSESGSDF